MKALMVALAIASALVSAPVGAQDASTMTLADFRTRNEQTQVYMVLGALALMGKLGVVCPQAIAVGEWRAALRYRDVPIAQPWIDVLVELMDERGCASAPVKADT